jgi:hypothetical protein
LKYIESIKKNRVAGNTDKIVCRNGKCRYECVWAQTDRGEMKMCIWALDLYDWQRLGDTNHTPARSCVGIYTPPSVPANASFATNLHFPFSNEHPLDAFDS